MTFIECQAELPCPQKGFGSLEVNKIDAGADTAQEGRTGTSTDAPQVEDSLYRSLPEVCCNITPNLL